MISYEIVGTSEGEKVVATEGGSRVGWISFDVLENVCNISELFVDASMRRQGIATMMMLRLWDRVFARSESGEIRIILPRENGPAQAFLENMGFGPDEQPGRFVSFRVSDVFETALMRAARNEEAPDILSLGEIRSPKLVKSLYKTVEDADFDIDTEKLFTEFDTECSKILVRDSSTCGFLFVKKINEKRVMLSFLYADAGFRTRVAALLAAAAQEVEKKYGPDCTVISFVPKGDGKDMARRLIGEERLKEEPVALYRLFFSENESAAERPEEEE